MTTPSDEPAVVSRTVGVIATHADLDRLMADYYQRRATQAKLAELRPLTVVWDGTAWTCWACCASYVPRQPMPGGAYEAGSAHVIVTRGEVTHDAGCLMVD